MSTKVIGRFAPSPTGRLHAGNIFAYLMQWLVVRTQDGRIVLRIEDLDEERSRPEYCEAIKRDLDALGLTWDEGPYYQHNRKDVYHDAFTYLSITQTIYPCFCTRSDLRAASAPHLGERVIYAGTCSELSEVERRERMQNRKPAFRIKVPDSRYEVNDLIQGYYAQNLRDDCGDFVLRRSDGIYAYQLAVTVDDAEQHISSIVRGCDLLSSTPQQIFLQTCLKAHTPTYAHIPLLMSSKNKRLAKRDTAASLDAMMHVYKTSSGVLGHIAYLTGLQPSDAPITCEELLTLHSCDSLVQIFSGKTEILWHS